MLSAKDIRNQYLRQHGASGANQESRGLEQDNYNLSSYSPSKSERHAPLNTSASGTEQLSLSARHIVREAKKQLGEHAALGTSSEQEVEDPSSEDLAQLIEQIEHTEGEELSENERDSALAALSASLDNYDILTPLVENKAVNDIIVQSYDDISIQTDRKNVQTDLKFSDREAYKAFIENLLKRAGKACTTATPVVDSSISPDVRACVTHESFSPLGCGPMLTLRVARHQSVSLEKLTGLELAPIEVMEYLAALVRSGETTFLIAGEVGTGKTTLVKALANEAREEEALLIIEDTHELSLERKFVRTLLTREANTEGSGRIPPATAIRTGMRMAMNRLILGEMRDAEAAEAFIDVCSSGHSGMSTIHARSARDAISRLELFLARAQGSVSAETIRKQIANAVSVVIHLRVDKETKKRRISEIEEIGASADGVIQFSPIYKFVCKEGAPEWRREAGISFYRHILEKEGVSLAANGEHLSLNPETTYLRYHRSLSNSKNNESQNSETKVRITKNIATGNDNGLF